MISDEKHADIIQRLDSLETAVTLSMLVHEKLLEAVKEQNELLKQIKDEAADDWWKQGEEPPCS